MIYEVSHRSTVHYDEPIRLARFNLRLKPAPWPGQRLLSYALQVDPLPGAVSVAYGPFVVERCRLEMHAPLHELVIHSHFRIEVLPRGPGPDVTGPGIGEVRRAAIARRDVSASSPASYLYPSPLAASVREIGAWARTIVDRDAGVVAIGRALMAAIHEEFAYDDDATGADTPPEVAFRQRRGVCQDFAHVLIIAARSLGLPAAYASGYLRTLPPPGRPRLVGADAMHAWAKLWCGDELGWVGFDPTNDVMAGDDHIFVGMGRDYGDVSPLDGVFHGGAGQEMAVAVDVVPVEPTAEPR